MYKATDPYAMDLLKKLLEVNPKSRIPAVDALRHPYFDLSRFEQKIIQPRIEFEAMVD